MADLRTELSFSTDPNGLHFITGYVETLADIAGIGQEATDALLAAVYQACREIVELAYEPGQPGQLTLQAELHPAALALAIRERGLPLDATVVLERRAPGWELVDHVFEESRWINRGAEGSELQLIKYLDHAHIAQQLTDEELAPADEDAPLAPEQIYTMERLRPEDAIKVAQAIYRSYGYSYPNQDIYYPDRITHLNASGELISVVALDEAREVVGHLALEREGLGPTAESGQAVVVPAHRHRGLLERMREFAEAEGERLGLLAVWSEAVTSHVYSQRMDAKFGAHVAGARLAVVPQSVAYKAIADEPAPQRESAMFYIKFLVQPPRATVHVPDHHRPMVERVYANLEAPFDFGEPREPAGAGTVTVSVDRAWGFGTIRVVQVGTDTATQIRQARRDLIETSGVPVVYLELPLVQPGTASICTTAEDDGFFFSGICPLFAEDGDILRLQYLNVPLDISRLQVYGAFGQELVAYAESERKRVS